MTKRLLTLGIVIDYILTHCQADEKPLLRRVFREQYEKAEDGTVNAGIQNQSEVDV